MFVAPAATARQQAHHSVVNQSVKFQAHHKQSSKTSCEISEASAGWLLVASTSTPTAAVLLYCFWSQDWPAVLLSFAPRAVAAAAAAAAAGAGVFLRGVLTCFCALLLPECAPPTVWLPAAAAAGPATAAAAALNLPLTGEANSSDGWTRLRLRQSADDCVCCIRTAAGRPPNTAGIMLG